MPGGSVTPPAPTVNLSRLSSWQKQFVAAVSRATSLDPVVVAAWVLQENGPSYNPLNIGPGKSFGSTQGAINATISLLRPPSQGGTDLAHYYDGILASAKSHNLAAEVAAIAASPWDGAHYGGTGGPHLWATLKSIDPSAKGGGSSVLDALGNGGSSVLDALGKVGSSAVGVPGALANAAVDSVLGKWTDPATWLKLLLRLVFVALGVALILIGVKRLIDPTGEKTAQAVQLAKVAA